MGSFTRDDIAAYEKRPQTTISDKVSPFRGATPAQAANAADVAAAAAAAASGQPVDITPGGGGNADAQAVADDNAPVVDEDGNLTGDQSETGEGTSDETSDSSTETVDHGDEAADPNADLTGEEPAKGSARERIVELNDKLEGTTIFARNMQEQLKTQIAINEALRAGLRPPAEAAAPAAAPRVVEEENPGPMPDMTDPDVEFDNDKYRAKMAKWSTANARVAARAIVREMTGATEAQRLVQEVNAKVEAYAKEHPEFETEVTNNEVLKANQLAPIAGLAIARSPFTAEILTVFGKDPGYAIRVAKMTPDQQIKEVGKIEGRIEDRKEAAKTNRGNPAPKGGQPVRQTGAQPARKSTTNAPPPPSPVKGTGRAVSRDPLDPNTSMDDFVRQHRQGNQAARDANRRARGLK